MISQQYKFILFLLASFILKGCGIGKPGERTGSSIWQTLVPGPNDVGFIAEAYEIDSTEHEGLSVHGKLQIGFWYPTKQKDAARMLVKDYIDLKAWDRMDVPETRNVIDTSFATYRKGMISKGVNESNFEILISSNTIAQQNAKIDLSNEYPIVFIAPGYSGDLLGHFILAEFLATNGFIVVSIPSIQRISIEPIDRVGEYLKVMSIGLSHAESKFNSSGKVGLIGFSLCGACITLFHDQVKLVDAVLSLDGWDGWDSGAEYVRNSLTNTPSELDITFAYLAEDPSIVRQYSDSPTEWDHDLVLELASKKGFISYFKDMRHRDFTSHGMMEFIAPYFSYNNWQEGSRLKDSKAIEYGYQSVLLFMSALLKGDPKAREELCNSFSAAEEQGILLNSISNGFCN